MLLAYLRGWITPDTQKQGLRSHLRQELILAALAAELDAEATKAQALAYSAALPALQFSKERAMETVTAIASDMFDASRVREFEQVRSRNATARGSPTIDGLFKLYQALIDAKVIPKSTP